MAREYLACPECQTEIYEPSEATFCKKCGVNLRKFKKLLKMTQYDPWYFCFYCHKPGVSLSKDCDSQSDRMTFKASCPHCNKSYSLICFQDSPFYRDKSLCYIAPLGEVTTIGKIYILGSIIHFESGNFLEPTRKIADEINEISTTKNEIENQTLSTSQANGPSAETAGTE